MRKIYTTLIVVLSFMMIDSLFAQEGAVNIHGFISQGYMKTERNNFIADSTDGTFQFNEMGINFGTQPLDKLRISLQFFARDLGSVGNDEIQVDYAYADYRLTDAFGIRAGRMKVAMGLYTETRDIDMLRTCIILPYSIYDENLRDGVNFMNGSSFYGDFNTERFGSLSYQVIAGSTNVKPDSATGEYLGFGELDTIEVNVDTTYCFSLRYCDPSGLLKIGGDMLFQDSNTKGLVLPDQRLSFLQSPGSEMSLDINNTELYVWSLEFTWNDLVLTYEVKYTNGILNIIGQDGNPFILPTTGKPMVIDGKPGGYYLMATYQFNDWFNAGVYYEEFYIDRNDTKGQQAVTIAGEFDYQYWMKKWAFSCKLNINANWLFKLETHYVDGTANVNRIYEDDLKRYWWLYAAKFSYNF